MSVAARSATLRLSAGSFWQRRIIAPIAQQLRQGITPEKIALTLSLGFVLSLFPILGSTTLLCGLAGVALRLNQPLIQIVNLLAYPLQLALLIPFYRAGESLFHRAPVPLDISLLLERFHADFARFLQDFWMIAVGGILVWLLVAPILFVAGYRLLRPLLRSFAGRMHLPAIDAQ